jgi:endonuclease-3 related protein
MLGAVLTQRTTWRNVDLALRNVLAAWGPDGLARPEMVLEASQQTLEALFRPTGYYTVKPKKVRNLAQFVADHGGIQDLIVSEEPTLRLRDQLLAVWGIGPETADAILLYALGRPIFVADAYALRLASRWGLLEPSASYNDIQRLFMDNLPHDPRLFNEYHALIVAHA